MNPEMKEKYAQEKYGKPFEELMTNQQRGVGGALRGGDLAQPELAPPPPEVKFGEDMPAPARGGKQGEGEQQAQVSGTAAGDSGGMEQKS